MLDAYSSLAMPLMYNHWSFGKLFAREEAMYRAGYSALAYEIVINSSPCISYLLEENSMTMQALVIAHAAFGHNHFFKNNYLFRQWTNAEGILDYLAFAKRYIAACEDRHGRDDVEAVLDSAHALMDQGVFRYRRPPKPSKERVLEKRRKRVEYEEEAYNELWRTLPAGIEPPAAPPAIDPEEDFDGEMKLPEENILYFLEKHSPALKAVAARNAAHRAQSRAVFLSAAPDQGDERRLRHLRALHVDERAVTTRASSPKARCSNSCTAIRAWYSSRNSTTAAITASIPMRSATA